MECANDPVPSEVAARLRQIGVSGPYAYQIAHGTREPSLPLAVTISKKTGLRLGLLEGANDEEVAVVTRLVERRS
jgi:hypothetical protein